MPKYDDAEWHAGGDFPKDLSVENGATHIGFFLTWCIENNLISELLIDENATDLQRIVNREISGRDFLLSNLDGKLTDEDLNEEGNAFAIDYYSAEGSFAEKTGSYLANYGMAVEIFNRETGAALETAYHVEDSWDFYEGIRILLNERFKQWKEFRAL